MEYHEIQDQQTLYLVRQDLFNGEYILTDHDNNFGELIYDGLARRTGDIKSFYGNWRLDYDFELFGKTEVLIYDATDIMLGKITIGGDYPLLMMADGFTAVFSKMDLLSNKYEWKSKKTGCFIYIENAIFSMTNTIKVINPNIDKGKTTLLTFLAQHLLLILERERRRSL